MLENKFICLMYHEIEAAGRTACRSNPGYLRYVVTESSLAQQLSAMQAMNCLGSTISEASRGSAGRVAITVDDCTTSDIEVFAPMLLESGFRATFYAVASWIDTANHLTQKDLRRFRELGMEIGSHSLTHSFLPTMSSSDMHRELSQSKEFLEQATGAPVAHFSCPFGGYSSDLLDVAMNVGYETVATSHIGHNTPGNVILNRIPIYRDTSLSSFRTLCRGGGLFLPHLRQTLLSPLKQFSHFQGYSK